MKKISIAIGAFQHEYSDFEAIKIAKEIGANAVDFDLASNSMIKSESIYSKGIDEITKYYTALKAEADHLGIEFAQTHGRIEGFMPDTSFNEQLIKDAEIDCMVTSILGAKYCVMHSATTIFHSPDTDPKYMHDINFDMFTKILSFAKKYDIIVASETFGDATGKGCCDFFGNIKEFIISYNRVCAVDDYKDYFKICVDTGHSNKATRYNNNPRPADVIRMLGTNIVCLHLNDNDTFTDQHKIPMTGTIDWNDVFNALDEIGYSGIYNMELTLTHFGANFMKEEAAFAIKVMRNILNNRYGK